MKALAFSLIGLAAVLAVLAVSDDAEATSNCQPTVPTDNVCRGYSHVSTRTGGNGVEAICFAFRTTNAAPTCTTGGIASGNEAAWEMDAGDCVTLRYYSIQSNTLLSPPPPNKVTLRVFYDSTATIVKTFLLNGAEPSDGDGFTFCATSNGDAGGSPRAGQYYAHLQPIKDNSAGGLQNYNIHSGGVASVGSILSYDSGVLRGRAFVSALTATGCPSSPCAYGAAGDETITVTGTFTAPGGDANLESMRTFVTDDATLALGQAGATVDVDAGSLAQGFVVDNTFTAAPFTAAAGLTVMGNGFSGEKWTVLASAGHGAGLTRLSDTSIRITATFGIDAGIKFDSDGAGTYATADDLFIVKLTNSGGPATSLFNKAETYYAEGYILNARSELVSRAMTIAREDATPTTCASGLQTPVANKYSGTGLLAGGCLAANDLVGSPRYFRATNTDQDHRSNEALHVSSLYQVQAHTQVSPTLGAEVTAFFIRDDGAGGDDSDPIRLFCQVEGVRGDLDIDTSGSAVTRSITDPAASVRATGTTDTAADGWAPALSLLATTPLGTTWEGDCAVSFNGNTGSDTQVFTVGVEGGGGETVYTGADPLTIFGGNVANGSVPITVHSRLLNGEARVGVADQIFVSVYEWPAMTAVVTGGAVVEVDAVNAPGSYVYNLTFPGPGAYLIAANTTDGATPIGAHNVIVLANSTVADILASINGHRDNSLEVLMTSDFAGLGFDGFLFLLFWVAAILFFVYKDWAFSLAFTLPGILDTLFPDQIPGEFAQYLLFCLLGVVMQYFVGDRQKFSLHGKKKPTGA